MRPWRSFRALQMSEFSDFTWEYSPWDITLKVGGSYIYIYIFIYDNMMVLNRCFSDNGCDKRDLSWWPDSIVSFQYERRRDGQPFEKSSRYPQGFW